jgi:acetyltransferase-like isoleucine patch superfamily enzyme
MCFHPTALVESDSVGQNTRVWAYVHILPDAEIGENCNIGDHCFIESGAKVGNNVTVKNNVCIWEGVTIENDVFVGPNVTFTNDRFPRSARMPRVAAVYRDKANWIVRTTVEQGSSIGANATVIAGSRVGRFSMIGAGAIVTRDVPPHTLVIGCPARRVAFVCFCGRTRSENVNTLRCDQCQFGN